MDAFGNKAHDDIPPQIFSEKVQASTSLENGDKDQKTSESIWKQPKWPHLTRLSTKSRLLFNLRL